MDLMQYLYYQNDIVLLVNSDFVSIISYIKYEKLNIGKCSTCSKETAQSWLKILGFFWKLFVYHLCYIIIVQQFDFLWGLGAITLVPRGSPCEIQGLLLVVGNESSDQLPQKRCDKGVLVYGRCNTPGIKKTPCNSPQYTIVCYA